MAVNGQWRTWPLSIGSGEAWNYCRVEPPLVIEKKFVLGQKKYPYLACDAWLSFVEHMNMAM